MSHLLISAKVCRIYFHPLGAHEEGNAGCLMLLPEPARPWDISGYEDPSLGGFLMLESTVLEEVFKVCTVIFNFLK